MNIKWFFINSFEKFRDLFLFLERVKVYLCEGKDLLLVKVKSI